MSGWLRRKAGGSGKGRSYVQEVAVRLDGAAHGLHVDEAVFGDIDDLDDGHHVTGTSDHVATGDDAGWVGASREVRPWEASLVLGAQVDAQADPVAHGRIVRTAGLAGHEGGGSWNDPVAQ
jgi:hypothetical protein